LIKQRASKERVDSLIEELECKLTKNFSKEIKDTEKFLKEDIFKFNDLVKKLEAAHDKSFMDVRKSFAV
jgi:chromosome condensin MukBEF complex kleisin-like MukF subunit